MSAGRLRQADDERFLRLALALGRRHLGRTWPNPSVGAVLVGSRDGESVILAEGITAPGGRPHAEQIAISAAGAEAKGAALYVSLEPCSHHGRTPPCTEAVARAGITRVVTALDDPDPRVADGGHAFLRANGVAVLSGLMPEEGRRAHLGHVTRMRLGRPAVILKLARTADGYAAAAPGEPRLMISGEAAMARAHLLRAEADAILVGIGTALSDDPRLDVRLPGMEARSPVRIVLDSRLRLPPASRLAASAAERPLWILCGPEADAAAEARLAALGAEVVRVSASPSGRIALAASLSALAARGLTRVFCEGGPTLADALAEADLLDEIWIGTADAPLGRPGLVAVGPALRRLIEDRMRIVASERVDPDTLVCYERR